MIDTTAKTQLVFVQDNLKIENILEEIEKEPIIAVDTEGSSIDPFTSKLLLLQIATKNKNFVFLKRKI